MKLYRCMARNKGCASLPKPIKPSHCLWMGWHKAKPDQFCPWANHLCKLKGDKRVQVGFYVEVKGASNSFGIVDVVEVIKEKKYEVVKKDGVRVVQADIRRDNRRKGKVAVTPRKGPDAGEAGNRYLGQAEARLEIERLMKGKIGSTTPRL